MQNSQDVVRRYYEAFNARNLDAYAELFAPDCLTEAPAYSARGLEGVRAFDRAYIEAFPKARIESLRMMSKGRHVATANWLHGGKHEGVLRSPKGDIPPTGASFDVPYCASFVVENGRITRQRLQFEAEFIPVVLGLS